MQAARVREQVARRDRGDRLGRAREVERREVVDDRAVQVDLARGDGLQQRDRGQRLLHGPDAKQRRGLDRRRAGRGGSLVPNPFANVTCPFSTTATATPGAPSDTRSASTAAISGAKRAALSGESVSPPPHATKLTAITPTPRLRQSVSSPTNDHPEPIRLLGRLKGSATSGKRPGGCRCAPGRARPAKPSPCALLVEVRLVAVELERGRGRLADHVVVLDARALRS